jgi:hypothetical protein
MNSINQNYTDEDINNFALNFLKPGDVLHCQGKGLIARGIMKFTKSEISHTALYLEIWGQPFIIDAQKDGTNPRPFFEWVRKYDYKFIITRPPQHYDVNEISKKALSVSGITPYNVGDLILRFPIYILTGRWLKLKRSNNKKRKTCGGFVSWVYNEPYYYKNSPSELYKKLIDRGFEIIKIESNVFED